MVVGGVLGKDKWISDVHDTAGHSVDSFSVMEQLLSEGLELLERQGYPFRIREHERNIPVDCVQWCS